MEAVIEKPTKKNARLAEAIAGAMAADDRNVLVPLSQLVLSEKYNVRKQGGDDVDELAALIDAHGLLQRLLIVEQVVDGKLTGKYEVNAGGRRWRALKRLAECKKIGKDELIECKLVDVDNAIEVSLAENSGREAMHPADAFAAFKRMADEGKSFETISARFGVSPLTVARRMRLANVSPVLMAKFRDDDIDLQQLMALAITDDHEKQEMVWENASAWERDAHSLRRMLTENEVDAVKHPLARFVGIESYEAAGGYVRRDLFSEEGKGGYLADVPLLRKLANEKLHAEAGNLKAEGWSWVEVRETFTYSDRISFGTLSATPREPNAEEQSKLDGLQAKSEELSAKIEQFEQNEDYDDEYEKTAQALDEVDEQIELIKSGLCEWSGEAKAHGGAVIIIDQGGNVDIRRGLVLPTDRKAAAVALSTTEHALGGKPPRAKPAISEKLMLKLSSHRTAALQAALMENHAVALVALAHGLVISTFSRFHLAPEVKVRGTSCRHSLKSHANDMIASRAWRVIEAQIEAWEKKLPDASELSAG